MLKLRKGYILAPILAVLFAFLMPKGVEAAKFEVGNYTLDKQSVVEDDLYVAGDSVNISGVVDGDVLVSGQSISIDGTVTGDVYAAGSTVTINGNVYGNVYTAGSLVSLDGTLGKNVIAAGMTVNSSADISQDITVAGGHIKLDGNIGDDVRAAAADITSTATVGGDFVFTGETYNLDENDIQGQFVQKVYEAPKTEAKDLERPLAALTAGINVTFSVISFIGMYLVGAVLIFLAPTKTAEIGKNITESWEDALKSFAIGLLVLFGLPIPLIFLAITLVGAPLSILVMGILFFLTVFGTVWAEIAFGHKILELFGQNDHHRYLSLLIGRFISVIVRLIPIVGGIYSLCVMMLTVGAVVRTKTHSIYRARNKKK